jgi:predicted phosphoadenosine phosphosulfate sulfurtransferase
MSQGDAVSRLKRPTGKDVLTAARERIAWVFDTFPSIYVSFSAGKDSTCMLHLAAQEARRRKRRFACMLIDLEAQYSATIDHGLEMFRSYSDVIDPYWVALPLVLRNAVSMYQPRWICWDPEQRSLWVREPPDFAITNPDRFPFYHYAMEFEEFVEQFGHWYGKGDLTACLVGIRSDESLNRFRTLILDKRSLDGYRWTTWKGQGVYNVYPIYDWRAEDDWTFIAREKLPHNEIYDRMHKAGLTIHQMRICQPYGDDQRKGLWLFHVLEPKTWQRVVARVAGANSGSMYAHETGNMSGRIKIRKPPGHTWESFAKLLLESMPVASKEHYENKIAVFLHWYAVRGYPYGIPDAPQPDGKVRHGPKGGPSWFRIVNTLLNNDWWCKRLSFGMQKSTAYEQYLKVMKNRRRKWGL